MTSLELLTEHITVQDDLKIAKTFFFLKWVLQL